MFAEPGLQSVACVMILCPEGLKYRYCGNLPQTIIVIAIIELLHSTHVGT